MMMNANNYFDDRFCIKSTQLNPTKLLLANNNIYDYQNINQYSTTEAQNYQLKQYETCLHYMTPINQYNYDICSNFNWAMYNPYVYHQLYLSQSNDQPQYVLKSQTYNDEYIPVYENQTMIKNDKIALVKSDENLNSNIDINNNNLKWHQNSKIIRKDAIKTMSSFKSRFSFKALSNKIATGVENFRNKFNGKTSVVFGNFQIEKENNSKNFNYCENELKVRPVSWNNKNLHRQN